MTISDLIKDTTNMYLMLILSLLLSLISVANSISCYVCESYRDFRCLDPFDSQPFPVVDCSKMSFVRDKEPVFCEKKTEVYDGQYITTRGCSVEFRWEDVQGYRDVSGGQVPCIRRKGKETCLCSNDWCNSSVRAAAGWSLLMVMALSTLLR